MLRMVILASRYCEKGEFSYSVKFHRPVRTFCKQDFSCQDTYHRFDHHDDGDPDGDGAAASFFNRQRCRLSPFCRPQARCGVLLNPSLRVRNRRNHFRPPRSPPPMSLHDLYSHHMTELRTHIYSQNSLSNGV